EPRQPFGAIHKSLIGDAGDECQYVKNEVGRLIFNHLQIDIRKAGLTRRLSDSSATVRPIKRAPRLVRIFRQTPDAIGYELVKPMWRAVSEQRHIMIKIRCSE